MSSHILVVEDDPIIRQTVEPDSWRETGGGDGSIRELIRPRELDLFRPEPLIRLTA